MSLLLIWCTVGPAVAAVLALAWRLLVGIRRLVIRIDDFMDDWGGEAARPGVPRRPGVMERLDYIEHQLKPNSGESLRDAVNRIENQLNAAPSSTI